MRTPIYASFWRLGHHFYEVIRVTWRSRRLQGKTEPPSSVILSPEFWSALGNRTHDLSLRSTALYVRSRSCFLGGGVAAGKQRHRSKRDGDGNIYVKKATRLVSRRTPLHMTYCCRRLFRYFTGLRNERQKDKWKLPWREVAEDH